MTSLCQSQRKLTVIAIMSAIFLLGIMMSAPIVKNVYADPDTKFLKKDNIKIQYDKHKDKHHDKHKDKHHDKHKDKHHDKHKDKHHDKHKDRHCHYHHDKHHDKYCHTHWHNHDKHHDHD